MAVAIGRFSGSSRSAGSGSSRQHETAPAPRERRPRSVACSQDRPQEAGIKWRSGRARPRPRVPRGPQGVAGAAAGSSVGMSDRAPGGLIQTGRKRLLPRTGEVLGNVPRKSPQPDPPSDCYAGRAVVGAGCRDARAPADRSRCLGRSGRLGNCSGQTGPGAPPELASCFATVLGSFAMRACPVYPCPGIRSSRAQCALAPIPSRSASAVAGGGTPLRSDRT
jgi:hypothetical protein